MTLRTRLLCLLLLAPLACDDTPSWDPTRSVAPGEILTPGAAEGMNLLLVTLDTTRSDRLGLYGYEEAITPTLDGLLEHGVRFDHAVTSAPMTLPSHAVILTGNYPPTTGVRDNGTSLLGESHLTLAEALKAEGYDTAAFIASFTVDARFGLAQGFDTYDFDVDPDGARGGLAFERRGDSVSDDAVAWVESRGGSEAPFFLWAHYFDPHHPYDAPIRHEPELRGRPYDAEITFMDRQIGRLFEAVREQGLWEETLVVVISDHGEGLFDHDEGVHGFFIYETTTHAAFVLSSPRVFDGSYRIDDRVVGTVDLMPTVIELLGVEPGAPMDGQSIATAPLDPDRSIYVETRMPLKNGCSPLYALRRHQAKYILAPTPEFYDLSIDPDEEVNRYDEAPRVLSEMKVELRELQAAWRAAGNPGGSREVSEEERQQLQSLGYVAGSGIAPSDEENLPDPKDRIHVVNQMTELERLIGGRKNREALALAREIVSQCEGWFDPVVRLAELRWKLGDQDGALTTLEEFAEAYPSAQALYSLARVELQAGKVDDALETLDAAAILDPGTGAVPLLRGDIYAGDERWEDAAAQYRHALEIDGARAGPMVEQRMARIRPHLDGD